MFRRVIVAATVAVLVCAAGLRAEAKKPPPPKVHLAFTYGAAVSYPLGTQSFTVTKKADLTVVGPAPDRLLFECTTRTKTAAHVKQVRSFHLLVARLDLAHQTYPLTVMSIPGLAQERTAFTVQSYPGGIAQIDGAWSPNGQDPQISVTFDSYDAKKRRLSGRFHGSLPDHFTEDPTNPLEIFNGEFVVIVPKYAVK